MPAKKAQPLFEGSEWDFEILQRSTISKTSYVNGAFSSTK